MISGRIKAAKRVVKRKAKHQQGAAHPFRDVGAGNKPFKKPAEKTRVLNKCIFHNHMTVIEQEGGGERVKVDQKGNGGKTKNKNIFFLTILHKFNYIIKKSH